MLSSCNIIKNPKKISEKKVIISTEYEFPKEEPIIVENEEEKEKIEEKIQLTIEEAEKMLENYKSIGTKIIQEAQKNKDSVMAEAKEKAVAIEKEAYEKGYEEGVRNGHEDGKKEAYESCLPEAEREANELKENAENILKDARKDYEDYLDSKKGEILDLAISIAEKILKKEIIKKTGINNLVEEAIELSKGEENVIVKCNSKHEEELRNNISLWKTTYNIKGEIFIIVDNDMEAGNAIIEKKSGKIKVGYDVGMEKIKKALLD